uniref:Vacuolar protein 14 C-terminal Fig4-binding domain-containing protein n=1 Tax=Spongospora subterranea TaxID=70186 RepID=A0A0H5R5Q6_9EUKA|eukprot:CRZ09463.1 hypothetical protein [Spongospora subterranea]
MAETAFAMMSSAQQAPTSGTSSILLSPAIARGLCDRSYEKRKAAALDLEHLLKQDRQSSEIVQLIAVLNSDFISSTQSNYRKGGLIGLAALAIGLGRYCDQYLDEILPPILLLMQDPENRCRYYACEALYNIAKISRGHVLKRFNAIYDGLCTLHADPDGDVRNGASLLDRLMKDIVTESDMFDITTFIPLLQDRMQIKDSAIRELNVGWIQVLDSVPDIDLLRYLPGILTGLLDMLSDSNAGIIASAEEVLSEFLNEISVSLPDTIELMIPVLVQQSSGDFPIVCKLMSLKWLESFVVLCKARLLPQYPSLINGLLSCMSETDHDGIRANAATISKAMMHQVKSSSDSFSYVEELLQQLSINLKMDNSLTKLTTLNWIEMLLQEHPDPFFKSINGLFPALIQTLSNPTDNVVQVTLSVLVTISRNPRYFDSVFTHVLDAFCANLILLKSRSGFIFKELCLLLDPRTVFSAIALLIPKRQEHNLEAINTIIQILNELLLTWDQLHNFRREVQNCLTQPDGKQLFESLFSAWIFNPVATLSLCLFCQSYDLASAVVCQYAEVQITVGFLLEIDRLVTLIESPVFVRLRLHLLEPHTYPTLIMALHGILMVLPSQGACFKYLATRLQSVSTLGALTFAPKSQLSVAKSQVFIDPTQHACFLDQFREVQKLYTSARLQALSERRIGSSAIVNLPLQ